MWLTEVYAISRFRFSWARATSAPYRTPATPITMITQAYSRHACGSIGIAMRAKPYVPILSSTPARMAEPVAGASVWAGGSQVCTGTVGVLIASPTPIASRTRGSGFWRGSW